MKKSIFPRTSQSKQLTEEQQQAADARWSSERRAELQRLCAHVTPLIMRSLKKANRRKPTSLRLTPWRIDVIFRAVRLATEEYQRVQAAQNKEPTFAEARHHLIQLEEALLKTEAAIEGLLSLLPSGRNSANLASSMWSRVERDNALRPRRGASRRPKLADIQKVIGVNTALLFDVKYTRSQLRGGAGRPLNDAFENLVAVVARRYLRITGCKPVVAAKPDRPNHFVKFMRWVYSNVEDPERLSDTAFQERIGASLKRLKF